MGTYTHFLAVYAYYEDPRVPGRAKTPLLAFSPLLSEDNYTAAEHVSFIEYTLNTFRKTTTKISFLVAYNENLNKAVARMLGVALIGCYSHRLHLAVSKFLEPQEHVLDKLNRLMVKLGVLKLARPR